MKLFAPRLLLASTLLAGFAFFSSSNVARAAADPSAHTDAGIDANAEVEAALARLKGASYRKRDQVFGMMAASGMSPPMVTEVSGDRSRLVVEMKLPNLGSMRTEQITVGSRTAVRTSAPALQARLEEVKRHLTVSSARNVLQQIASIAMAVQTGGLSTVQLLMEVAQSAATIKSTAEARAALNRASAVFETWQLMKNDADAGSSDFSADTDDMPPGMPGNFAPPPGAGGFAAMKAEKKISPDGKTAIYTRRPTMDIPGAANFHGVVYVDLATGLPTAEENFINGERLMRTDYLDVGLPIHIEVPDCLK
jgi:hypothetical protein